MNRGKQGGLHIIINAGENPEHEAREEKILGNIEHEMKESPEHEAMESPEEEKKEHEKDSKEYGLAPDNKEDMEMGGADYKDMDIEELLMKAHSPNDFDSKSLSLGKRAALELAQKKKGK